MATQSDRMSDPRQLARSDVERIRQEIEDTRNELTRDLNRLADRTSPKRVVRRTWHRIGDRVSNVSHTIMGVPQSAGRATMETATEAGHRVQDVATRAGEGVRDAAQSAAETVRETPEMVARQTRGNPIAVGLIAFGAGLLAATLIPETEAERRAGDYVAEHSDELLEPLRQPLAESATQVKEEVMESARESAQQLRDTATEAAQHTMETAKESGQRVTSS